LVKTLLVTSQWASTMCWLTWTHVATPRKRLLFRLVPSMHDTAEIGSGWWPTATTQDNPQVRGVGKTIGTNRGTTLGGAVRLWPTPSANEDAAGTVNGNMQFMLTHAAKLSEPELTETGGQLNPNWVEWLMGFPSGWTDLKHSETP
jgi:hypothetical protein